MKAKNITRFNYKKTAFQGWRLALSRKGHSFIKYFGDSQYANYRESFRAALEARDAILHELKQPGADPAVVFNAAKEWLSDKSAD
jgi:hypothetical protein